MPPPPKANSNPSSPRWPTLEKQLADDTQKIRDQYDPAVLVLETVKLTPVKKNIQVTATGILWLAKA
jgi:hypothetical protein